MATPTLRFTTQVRGATGASLGNARQVVQGWGGIKEGRLGDMCVCGEWGGGGGLRSKSQDSMRTWDEDMRMRIQRRLYMIHIWGII